MILVTTDDGRTIEVQGSGEKDGRETVDGIVVKSTNPMFPVGRETWCYFENVIREEKR